MGTTLQIHTLGGLTISIDDTPVTGFDSRKVQALLVYLACTGRTLPREVLAELFWEERTQTQALSNLRVALHSLNQTVGEFVDVARESVSLRDSGVVWLDASEFEMHLAAAGNETAQLEAALDLYQGDFLAGFFVDSSAFEQWTTRERERLRLRVMEGLDRLITGHLAEGNYAAGIRRANQLLATDPLREETHEQLMRLLGLSGQRGKALEQYDTLCRVLDEEFGVTPLPQTVALYEQLRAGDLSPDVTSPAGEATLPPVPYIVVANPYKGLCAFEETDADDFFGREALVNRLLARLAEDHPLSRFLAVVGPSGSGKSSVVRAGVIPALRRGALPGSAEWSIVTLLPGGLPFDEIGIALRRAFPDTPVTLLEDLRRDAHGLLRALRLCLPHDRQELLLVIDQFEEVFTLVSDPGEARRFLDGLYVAATTPHSPVRVLITLRADFYDRPLMIPDFSELVRQRTEVITPMTPEELERAITVPAQRIGVMLEPGLAAAVAAEVSQQPGALPLMEYALTEVFDRRTDHTLTLAAYEAVGGALGALARRADQVYTRFTPERQAAARQMCLRLITLGEGTEDTRRRTLQSELLSADGETARAVLHAFDRARLLTFDRDPRAHQPTVELAHETIIREWKLLRTWLDESRDDIRQQRMLNAAADEWENAGRDRSYLLTGSRLAQFEGWAEQSSVAMTPDERAYLGASSTEDRRQRTRRRRLRNTVLTAAILVAVVMTGLSIFAFGQRNDAEDARAASDANAARARDLALVNGAQAALAKGDPDTALALAVAANRPANPSAQAQMILSEATYSPGTARVYDVNHRQSTTNVSLSPDGRTAVSSSWGSTVTIWDVTTGAILHELLNYEDGWTAGLFSPDGGSVLTVTGNTEGTEEVRMALWDAASGSLVRTFDTDRVLNTCVLITRRFSPDGRWYIGSNGGGFPGCPPGDEAELIIWDISTGHVARTIQGFKEGLLGAEFGPDSRTILTVMNDATLAVVDAETGQIVRQFGERQDINTTGWFNDIFFTPDGRTAITVRSTGTVIVWDMEKYQEIRRFEAGPNWIWGSADLSADGRTLAVVSTFNNGVISLWDVSSGTLLVSIAAPGQATSVQFLPDEHMAVVGLATPLLRLIDLQNGAQINRLPMVRLTPYRPSVAVSPDGNTLLACIENYSDENNDTFCQAALFDAATGAEIQRLGSPMAVDGMRFSADGQRVVLVSNATVPDEYLATVWDVTTKREVGRFEHTAIVRAAVFSPDGSSILLGDTNGLGILWDVMTSQELTRLESHTLSINDVEFSPDGRMALTSSQDGLMILWDVSTGQEIRRFDHGIPINSIEFSPDGQMAISGSDDGLARLWDLNTGAELRRFVGHASLVYDVHFSPDGRAVLTSGNNEAILQWDVATGQAIRRYPFRVSWRFALSPDGRSLFVPSTEPDSAIYQYRVDTAQELLVWTLENRYVRDLTCEERAQYGIEPLCD